MRQRAKILGKTILFVTAHPDDESYAAAGTILKNHEAGGTSYIACATFGERGKSHLKRKITLRQLKALRKKELIAACRYLKVSGLLATGLPDTGLGRKFNQDAFFKKLLPFAAKQAPDLIIGFGEDGVSGHVDHIAAGKVAGKVARKLKIPFLKFSAPPWFRKRMELLKKRRKHGAYVKDLKHQPYDFFIRVDPVKKMKTLFFHKSQFDSANPFPELAGKDVKQFLSKEYFSF